MSKKVSTVNPTIQFLTDEIIDTYAGDNVVNTHKDFNLHIKSRLEPYAGGIFDKKYFGSVFSGQCNCGRVKTIGMVCPNCGSRVLDEVSSFSRFGKIELPIYYCNELRYPQLIKFLKTKFNWRFDIETPYFKEKNEGSKSHIKESTLENLQFEYDEENDAILMTDKITDYNKCSFEGLIQVIRSHYPDKLSDFTSYINTSVLVVPVVMRAPQYVMYDGKRKLKIHQVSVIYQNILYAIGPEFYENELANFKSSPEVALFRGIIRRFITTSVATMSRLLKPSKASMARNMQSNRLSNSGRCIIVPSPDLKVDEVYIPRHLMYEACREEFIEYLEIVFETTPEKAEYIYKVEATSAEVQKHFDDYINGDGGADKGKYVVINRNPTLYELNIMVCKVKLTNDYAMGIPLLLCQPFGGDFDGDTFSFYAIPKQSTEFMVDAMSPRNLIYYKKNHKPLFLPTHEMMQGLIFGTRTILNDNLLEFSSLEEAEDFRKHNRNFKYQTVFLLNGNQTTIAREIIGSYFGTNLNDYLNGLERILDAKNIVPLYCKLDQYQDRVERIQGIQEFALKLATISGATAPTLSHLYLGIDHSKLDDIKKIEEDERLSDSEKDVKIRELYSAFVEEESSKFDDSVRTQISDSSRSKISQLLNISLPQLNVGPDKKSSVTVSTLIEGKNPADYEKLAIENRAVQDIKVGAVPLSGNLTRQFVFLASSYSYSPAKDEKNKGIVIRQGDAMGRTRIDGTIVTEAESKSSPNKEIKVRSIVTSSTPTEPIVTSDMISNRIAYKDDSHVGISLISSLTEGLTQSGLSLKHGGALFNLDPLSKIVAPEDCTVSITDSWIILNGSKEYKFPKPSNFTQNFNPTGVYKKGETVGASYHIFTPSYRLDCLITLCEARGIKSTKSFARNKVLVSDCYAVNSGTIKYQTMGDTLKVTIGGATYSYNKESLYLFPDGAQVNAGDRICTGVVSIRSIVGKTRNYVDTFYFFRKQFDELIEGMNPELIEFLYTLIVRNVSGRISVKKVISAIHEKDSIFTRLAFEDAKKTFKKIGPEGEEFTSDTITMVLMSLLFNNSI